MDIGTPWTITKLLIETLTEKILTAAWSETEFDHQDKPYHFSGL